MDFLNREITSKKARAKNVDILTTKIYQKSTWKQGGFFEIEITLKKKHVETTQIFEPSKLRQKKYVETT